MSEFRLNILVAGRTGSGKSAFVNYLYGAPVRKVGAGRPVTEMGLFCEELTLENGITLNVHDTWGLEPDKAADWENLLLSEVHKHDKGGAADWFHTVFYCVSAAGARIEDFELRMMNKLRDAGCRVLVVLTHCDAANAQIAADAIRNVILQHCTIHKRDILCVSSVEKTLLGGQKVQPFGKEAVLSRLTDGLWEDLRGKTLMHLQREAEQSVQRWTDESEALIRKRITLLTSLSDKAAQEVSRAIDEGAQQVMAHLRAYTAAGLQALLDVYALLMRLYGQPGMRVCAPQLDPVQEYRCDLAPERKNAYAFCTALLALVPVVQLALPAHLTRLRRGEFTMELMRRRLDMQTAMQDYLRQVEKLVNELTVDG